MIPTKAKDLIAEHADTIQIPEEDLKNMVNFYFKENRKLLSNLSQLLVRYRGLGTMLLKGWDIKSEIERTKERQMHPLPFDTPEKLQRNLNRLEVIQPEWQSYKERQKELQKKKQDHYKTHTNESKGKTTNSLEE